MCSIIFTNSHEQSVYLLFYLIYDTSEEKKKPLTNGAVE